MDFYLYIFLNSHYDKFTFIFDNLTLIFKTIYSGGCSNSYDSFISFIASLTTNTVRKI